MKKLRIFLFLLVSSVGYASGGSVHMWMTSVAIDKTPQSPRKAFLTQYKPYAINGSVFPDSGYASVLGTDVSSGESYGETAHWPPFINTAIAYIKSLCRDGSGKIVLEGECAGLTAFIFGSAAHAIEDVFYDGNFLDELCQRGYYPSISAAAEGDANIDLYVIANRTDYDFLSYPDPVFRASFQHMTNIVNQTPPGNLFPESKIQCGMDSIYSILFLERPLTRFYKPSVPDWVSEHIFDGRGGVDETASVVANLWEELWIQITESPAAQYHPKKLVHSGPWPYITMSWVDM